MFLDFCLFEVILTDGVEYRHHLEYFKFLSVLIGKKNILLLNSFEVPGSSR